MAINQNHQFEDLEGIKCAIVERNVSVDRSAFLKNLLEFNGFTVIMVPSPPPKAAAAPVNAEGQEITEEASPSTYTIGVTDVVFNSTNAIFGRLLNTPQGHVVTMAYWQQKDSVSQDWIPYYSKHV